MAVIEVYVDWLDEAAENDWCKDRARATQAFKDAEQLIDVIQVAAVIERQAADLQDAGLEQRAGAVAAGKFHDRPGQCVRIVKAPITVALRIDGDAFTLNRIASIR